MQVIGDMFPDGGEIYSEEDLIKSIKDNLGYCSKQAKRLINDCVNAGFLLTMDDKLYTR